MSDADGDSQMRSSSDEDESEVLFPSANDLPKKHNPTSSIFPSELSPPASQEAPDDNGFQDEDMDLTGSNDTTIGKKFVGTGVPSESHLKDDHETKGDLEQEPGHSWSNKKAKEEYQRAFEQVLDKNFNLREFGDFLSENSNTSEKKS